MHYFKKGSVVKFNTKSGAVPIGGAYVTVFNRDKSGKIASRIATNISLIVLEAYNYDPIVATVCYVYATGDVRIKLSNSVGKTGDDDNIDLEFRISRVYLKPNFFALSKRKIKCKCKSSKFFRVCKCSKM